MLSVEENELLCRVGPGTEMGAFMRQYWVPALVSTELAEPDCPPVRVKLLGEELIAFRDTSGQVGLIAANCQHRGASLFFGRNEERGLRCVYHGWKYDVTGACVDMPNEPPESNFKTKIRAMAYACRERGGVVWAYMGPRREPPPLPDFEANMLPEGQWRVTATMRECNYLQALEGDIDTSHSPFLHSGTDRVEDTRPGTFQYYRVQNRSPRFNVLDTDFGTMYGAHIGAEADSEYWRIACYLFPFYTIIPQGLLGHQVHIRAWVPMDDTHMMFIYMDKRQEREVRSRGAGVGDESADPRRTQLAPRTTDWYGRFRLRPNLSNDYFVDREKQQRKLSFSGIEGVAIQDKAATESQGLISDRTKEHLVSSDAMIIRTRQRLIQAARAFHEKGLVPPGVDDPDVYRVRGGGVILPKDADWLKSTEELRRGFVEHPELDPAIVGLDRG
ncbi:MAG: Phthalate 4,5-dioxygenase [Chloroflexi bacterium]|nr:Phthalate 4,5-dioxygenase [Chloroflexota bacterium]